MALPVLPALGAALGLGDLGGRWVRLGIIVAVLTALTAVLAAGFGTLLNSIQETAPPELGLALGLMPSNVPACLAALIACALARWVYDVHARILFAVNS